MKRIGSFVTGFRRVVTGAAVALLAMPVVGCDTVAEISFPQREFTSAVTVGMLNAANCGGTDTEVTFRFAPFDSSGNLIAPGQQLGSELVTISGAAPTFTEQDVEFTNAVLYPSPDQPCTSQADCTAPFTCVPVNPFQTGNSRLACGMDVIVETLQRPLIFDEGADQKSIALVLDFSRTLQGVTDTGGFDPECSTDRLDERISAARSFLLKYRRSSFGPDSDVCVVSFGGQDVGGVLFDPTPQTCLTGLRRDADFEAVDSRISDLGVGETGASPVWAALVETIEQQLASESGDRILILFTDGPDDGSVTSDFSRAVATAVDNGAQVHVVQLDHPPEGAQCGVVDAGPGTADEFAQLACATGGSYQYASGPEDLRTLFDNVAGTVGAYYQVEAQVIALASLPPGVYRLAAGVQVNLGGTQVTLQLAGDKSDPATLKIIDDRLTVFTRPVPPDEVPVEENGDGTQ